MGAFRLLLAIVASLGTAFASTFGTDISDLWYDAAEPGWGVNLVQQDDTLFATMFVYGADGKPTWYVASDVPYASQDAYGVVRFSGPLYQTSGPWFGGPFDPNAVGVRQVGTITFAFGSVSTGTVKYTADGVAVSKSITRQTWKNNRLAGDYLGAMIGSYSYCSGGNGYQEEPATFTITQSGSTLTLVATRASGTCTYSGTYVQSGRMGSIANGDVSCTNGFSGKFTAGEIEGGYQGFTARAVAQSGTCQWVGHLGGLYREP